MKKLIILVIAICCMLVGCSSNENSTANKTSNEVTEIRFKDMIDVEELRKLDGQKVKITGFMAQMSPLDGSMIYLMNMPYQSCVYCVPNTNQLVNTMAVYSKNGKQIEYTDLAVEVVGTIKFEDITDEMGYSYNYRIIDADISYADVDALTEEVKIYTDLVNKGFVDAISQVILELNTRINYESLGLSTEYLSPISDKSINNLESMFSGLERLKYSDIYSVVNDLKSLCSDINNVIEAGEYSKISEFKNKELEIFYDVYDWLMKPQL